MGEVEVSCWQAQRRIRKMTFILIKNQVSGEQVFIRERSRMESMSYQQKRERE